MREGEQRVGVVHIPHCGEALHDPLVCAKVDVAVAAGVVGPREDDALAVKGVPVLQQRVLERAWDVLRHLKALEAHRSPRRANG